MKPVSTIGLTDKKPAAERGQELAAQRLAAIVKSSDDAILSKDLNGIITSWNKGAERIFGYTEEETLEKPVTMLMPPERQNEEPVILARIRRGERVDHYETVRQRKDGSLIDISLTVSPIKDANGHVVGASKIARDITERKRAEERRNLLLREMNHRIKNLFAIAGSIVALSARDADTPEALARSAVERLAALGRAQALTLTKPANENSTHKLKADNSACFDQGNSLALRNLRERGTRQHNRRGYSNRRKPHHCVGSDLPRVRDQRGQVWSVVGSGRPD